MSDLSWLNPTPHAIAVYASRPLSPVATQHSLPSGRYSLLRPDFHRLDHTSFAWRTHSITSSARASNIGGISTEGFRSREVDDQLKFGGQIDLQVVGLGTLENSPGINTRATISIGLARSVTHEAADLGIIARHNLRALRSGRQVQRAVDVG